MAGSRVPGPTSDSGRPQSLEDGTGPRTLAPGAGVAGSSTHVAATPAARAEQAPKAAQTTLIDEAGVLKDARVKAAIARTIERGKMQAVHGIIVHQTGGSSARSALESYKSADAKGAHFLIDKDGTIYQTASLHQRTWHVGKLRARCLLEMTCDPAEVQVYRKFDPSGTHKREMKKAVPQRFPGNDESVGIELVGRVMPEVKNADGEGTFEPVTAAQNKSLQWLISELTRLLGVPVTEIFRHPTVSHKNVTEASTATW